MKADVVQVIDECDLKDFLFVCLKRDREKVDNNKMVSGCHYAVFNEIGENVELVFGKMDKDKNEIDIEQRISPSEVVSGKKLKTTLHLNNSNFMTLKEAENRKYLISSNQPLKFDPSCNCLVREDNTNPNLCPEDRCVLPKKIYLLKNKKYGK